ncbi:LysM peptidoglycan-binding domain-containing protein [Streptomyces sp. LP05-1]|uniref:LysM peptidoglycan-binding domain-containing protein n=1 Tax=Streptomyces pyxinae TaxID=2970734 RepID=A0ABT2CJB1_9ACTN|nr:LysM peptidoglycan-binding domain-containing protein [Streptomyces sp. LP05-1]MCS0637511.1 LysM peptidoglycan-binding domain-containing protein [Streptomyces sp. LP05-1]
MRAQGKHSRSHARPLVRRALVAGTGGVALVLPLIGAATATAAPQQAPAVVRAAAPVTYSVVAGDTLSKIATEHAVSGGWKKLYEDNKQVVGADPGLIRPGLKLTVGAKAPAAERADRSARTTATPAVAQGAAAGALPAVAPAAAPKTYTNDLDGWIKEALDIMAKNGIPGSYDGIHRNVMRESSGNPLAINNWDSNAVAGTPSKGLLQVIDPTFQAYHVAGTSLDSYDPVANIVAACNYAADRYGSIDNVNGPY